MARFEIHFLDDRSDESLLNEVRRVAAGYSGSNLTLSEFAKLSSKVSGQTLRKRFGTWGNALERAGLAHLYAAPRRYTEATTTPEGDTLLGESGPVGIVRSEADRREVRPATHLNVELHADHIVSVHDGGKTTLQNLQTQCSVESVFHSVGQTIVFRGLPSGRRQKPIVCPAVTQNVCQQDAEEGHLASAPLLSRLGSEPRT